MNRALSAVATGDLDAREGVLYSCALAAGSDAAAAVVRSGGAGGTVLCRLAALAGTHAERRFVLGVAFSNPLHLTLTGTGPVFDAEV